MTLQIPLSGLPPTEAELQVQRFVRSLHRQAQQAPIEFANGDGAFPGVVLLPQVFPLVLDANMIRGELIRMARTGRTVLVNAANTGIFRLFVAQHVVDEVCEHQTIWARKRGVDPADVSKVWERELRPLLRCVDVPRGWLTAEESSRIARLARPAPEGDPDDVPTAVLALLLEAPLLSRDGKVLEAVYGLGFDQATHKEWLGALMAGGDLGPLGEYSQLSRNIVVLLGRAVIGGLRAAVSRWSWPTALSVILASSAFVVALIPADRLRHGVPRVGNVIGSGLGLFVAVERSRRRAEEQFGALAAPSPSEERVLVELEANVAVGRVCLRELARAPESRLSRTQLQACLSARFTIPGGAATVGRALDRWPCFRDAGDGQHQVGRALVVAHAG